MLLNSIKKIFKINILIQLIGLMIIPLLAINYTLEDLGVYAFVFSLSLVLGTFIGFRIENAFFSSKIREVENILFPIIIVSLLLCIFLMVFLWFFDFELKYLISIYGGMLIALFNIFYNYNVRISNEKKYNTQKITRAFIEFIVVIVCVLMSLDIIFCIFMVLTTYSIFVFNKIEINFNLKDYFLFFLKKKDLILSDLGSSIMFSSYNNGPTLFLSNVDLKLSGLYFILYKFFLVPSLMLAQSVGTILKQYGSSEYELNKSIQKTLKDLRKIFFKFKYILLLFFFAIFIFFYILDKFFYKDIFTIFLIMIPCVFLRFFHLSYSSLVYVLSMQKSYLILNLLLFFTTLFSSYFSRNDAYLYLFLYSFLSSIIYILYANFFFKRFKVSN